jgi:hypothetical protein
MKTIKIGKFEIVNIGKLKPSEYNREINDKHVDKQGQSLLELGWAGCIIVDNDYNILDGHHKYNYCKKQKIQEVPIYKMTWLKNLTGKEILSVILKLNAKTLNWKPEQLLSRYAKLDYDYSVANKEQEFYGIKHMPPSTLVYAFFNNPSSSNQFREGRCKIIDLDYTKEVLSELSRLRNEYGDSLVGGSSMREIARQSWSIYKKKINLQYLIDEYEDMLSSNHQYCYNIKAFKKYFDKKIKRSVK